MSGVRVGGRIVRARAGEGKGKRVEGQKGRRAEGQKGRRAGKGERWEEKETERERGNKDYGAG